MDFDNDLRWVPLAICKNCIYLTRFLSRIDGLVYFQFQIQQKCSIEDLNSLRSKRSRESEELKCFASRLNSGRTSVCELRVPGRQQINQCKTPRFRLSSNHSDRSVVLQRQNKIPEKQCNQF